MENIRTFILEQALIYISEVCEDEHCVRKAEEALRTQPQGALELLGQYESAMHEYYMLNGVSMKHGVPKIAPYRERAAQAQKINELRGQIVEILAGV
jgi:hypothetical protein